jgi:hypothetical protein
MTARDAVILKFYRDDANAEEIQAQVEVVVAELGDPSSESSRLASAAGLDPADMAGTPVSVTEEQGIEPVSTMILIALVTKVGPHIVNKFWDDVISPRLRRELGGKAVGEKEPGPSDPSE